MYKLKLSRNKIIDDFIRYTHYTQINYIKNAGIMEFVLYDQFKNVEFIAEGGFSKIYKATWIDGPISNFGIIKNFTRKRNYTVVLKKLNNSKNITPKELNKVHTNDTILSLVVIINNINKSINFLYLAQDIL